MASTDTEISQGLGATAQATSSIPGVGALLSVASSIANLFGAAHAAAVAKEASTLNAAIPSFVAQCQKVMTAAQAGAITEAQAIAYLQDAKTDYYTTVSTIIKQGGPCASQCTIGAESNAGEPTGWISTQPTCCNTSGTCNASCCLGCYLVTPAVAALSQILANGKGTYTIPSAQQNGQIAGSPLVTITYQSPSVLTAIEGKSSITSAIESLTAGGSGTSSTLIRLLEFAAVGIALFFLIAAIAGRK